MTQNYHVSSLLPKTIDSDFSGTTNLKISPVLKFFLLKNIGLTPSYIKVLSAFPGRAP